MTKARKLRIRLGDPYPAGPRACMRTSHVSGACSRCGRLMDPAHSPLHIRGLFCAACCPCCSPVVAPVALGAAILPLPESDGSNVGHQGARGSDCWRSGGRKMVAEGLRAKAEGGKAAGKYRPSQVVAKSPEPIPPTVINGLAPQTEKTTTRDKARETYFFT